MEIAGYVALIGVGLLLSVMGGGGSILSVPILVYMFSLDIVVASAYSLFIVGSTSLIGTVVKQKHQLVDVHTGRMLGIPSVLATFSTRKWVVCAIPDPILQMDGFQLTKRFMILSVFAIVLLISSVLMIMDRRSGEGSFTATPWFLYPIGLFTGFLSGLVGVGGGFLILPALVLVARLPFNKAVGTTLLVITFNCLLGFLGDLFNHVIDWTFLFSITMLAVSGVVVGNLAINTIAPGSLRKFFGWFTLLTGLWILMREL